MRPALRGRSSRGLLGLAAALLAATLVACGGPRTLIVTPYVVECECDETCRFAAVPAPLRSGDIPIIYVTDRAPSPDAADPSQSFSYRRGGEIRFGVATVSFAPAMDWPTLVRQSRSASRGAVYRLGLESIAPMGSLTGQNAWLDIVENRMVIRGDAEGRIRGEEAAFQELVRRWLDVTPRKEVFLFVHGFNNHFEDAVFRIAELWHFLGRVGVPITYTWPAGRGGLRGYAYDRESGEYTVLHLKQVLRALARMPDLERINIIAHSRGTDVTVSALRELYIEARVDQASVDERLKLGTLVLAAPDIDYDVFTQRFGGEMLVNAPRRTVIYFSPDDEAIWFARWLFDSLRRLGSLMASDLSESDRKLLARLPRLEMVDCAVSGFSTSHNYVFSHPSAMSDLLVVLRDDADPGTPQRPLRRSDGVVWELDNAYLCPPGGLRQTFGP
ncbi:MAG TPA: alpha/beta hydrolase [Phycisphaerales bacterium]|nr:alpha/beta hydrolase [Phycisphaerales bacterium]HMP36409.1 alpha/beta hydrolase [Phycisphaerales bacterium]